MAEKKCKEYKVGSDDLAEGEGAKDGQTNKVI